MGIQLGLAIVLRNRHIRKMLRLAEANENDVFYDLGCGAGQLCIIAVKEFNVKRAVGIDVHKGRVKRARESVRCAGLQKRISIRYGLFENANFKDATIVYNGLMEEEDTLEKYESTLRKGCRLITLASPPVSLMPNKTDYPFYLMNFPFTKASTNDEWASAVLLKQTTFEELLLEFKRDPDYKSDIRLLKKLAKERFKTLETMTRQEQ
jgi:SAM-dependent methyltransferase